jgi:hypothetical protein
MSCLSHALSFKNLPHKFCHSTLPTKFLPKNKNLIGKVKVFNMVYAEKNFVPALFLLNFRFKSSLRSEKSL